MRMYLLSGSAIAFLLLFGGVSSAQLTASPPTQAETKAFPTPIPPGKSWTAVKVFQFAGDYMYTQTPKPSPTENYYLRALTYNDYDYYYFGGTRGKSFNVFITYGGTPAADAASCGHTHLNYGVKGYYTITFFGITYHGWVWIGGGTQSGTWNNTTHVCTRSVNNPYTQLDPNLGWGQDAVSVAGTSGSTYIDAIVLVVMAPTHGAGDCDFRTDPRTGISFKACLDPVNVYAYTLAL